MIWLPSLDQIFELHALLIERTGGASGIRDAGLVESALMRARAGFGEVEAYDTLPLKAAAVCCGLISNHGFVDGNKRVGIAALCLILRKNETRLAYTQQELITLGLTIAQGEMSEAAVAEWIIGHADGLQYL